MRCQPINLQLLDISTPAYKILLCIRYGKNIFSKIRHDLQARVYGIPWKIGEIPGNKMLCTKCFYFPCIFFALNSAFLHLVLFFSNTVAKSGKKSIFSTIHPNFFRLFRGLGSTIWKSMFWMLWYVLINKCIKIWKKDVLITSVKNAYFIASLI